MIKSLSWSPSSAFPIIILTGKLASCQVNVWRNLTNLSTGRILWRWCVNVIIMMPNWWKRVVTVRRYWHRHLSWLFANLPNVLQKILRKCLLLECLDRENCQLLVDTIWFDRSSLRCVHSSPDQLLCFSTFTLNLSCSWKLTQLKQLKKLSPPRCKRAPSALEPGCSSSMTCWPLGAPWLPLPASSEGLFLFWSWW